MGQVSWSFASNSQHTIESILVPLTLSYRRSTTSTDQRKRELRSAKGTVCDLLMVNPHWDLKPRLQHRCTIHHRPGTPTRPVSVYRVKSDTITGQERQPGLCRTIVSSQILSPARNANPACVGLSCQVRYYQIGRAHV